MKLRHPNQPPPRVKIEPMWYHVVGDPGDDLDLDYLDDDLQAAFDELSSPDPELIVRTLYGKRPDLDRELYRPLVRRARRRWWPHLTGF